MAGLRPAALIAVPRQDLFKVLYEAIFTPLTYVVVKWVKKKEGIDTFDYNEKYNPIKG